MKNIILAFLSATIFSHSFTQINSTALTDVFGKKGMISGNAYSVAFPVKTAALSINSFEEMGSFFIVYSSHS